MPSSDENSAEKLDTTYYPDLETTTFSNIELETATLLPNIKIKDVSADFFSKETTTLDTTQTTTTTTTTTTLSYITTIATKFLHTKKFTDTMALDPCLNYNCQSYTVPGPFCVYYIKTKYDINCFLPCLTENCTKETQFGINCPEFNCELIPNPTPSPTPPTPIPPTPTPSPTPIPPSPTPVPPNPTPTPSKPAVNNLGLGFGIAGKNTECLQSLSFLDLSIF